MTLLFISLRFLDILDIFLVAVILHQLYRIIKGSVAINIFAGIFALYLLWLIVKALEMELLSSILGQFIGVGVIALIIVFQQEIRRFLVVVGARYMQNNRFSFDRFFSDNTGDQTEIKKYIDEIIKAFKVFSATKTGALIVVSKSAELRTYADSGTIINSEINSRLIESLFFKNSSLHDGAVIIVGNRIKAAGCVLPVTQQTELPQGIGLRHKAAVGMSEETQALIIIVSEETGKYSYALSGNLYKNVTLGELRNQLIKELS